MRTLLAICLLLLTLPVHAALIEGRIVADDGPVSGVRVVLYPGLDYSGEPLLVAAPSDSEGYYRIEVPAGTYALFVRDVEQGLFAFCGRNPVTVENGTVWAGLQAVPLPTAEIRRYDDEYSAAIEGRITSRGEPVTDAYAYLYLDVDEGLKGQGYRLSMPTGPDGQFYFDGLPESSYFLMVRKRLDGNRVGPVREGDLLGVYGGNPVIARSGTVTRVTIPVVEKVKSEAASETITTASGPVVTGRVVDDRGEPVAGLHVFAYTDRVIGHKRPAALSVATGTDGRFQLNLGQPGTYYIGARQEYGDSPAPGELFGMYDQSADHGLTINADSSIDRIEIVVEPISLQ